MYTYAFLLINRPLDLPEGIWGSLELVCHDQLAALVEPDLSVVSLQHDRQLMQAVLSHDRVIQEVFQQTVVLPLRFGTYFVSRQGLLDHLRSHQAEYLDKLTSLQGKAEYVLKLAPSFPESMQTTETHQTTHFLAKPTHHQPIGWQQQSELKALISLIGEYYPEIRRGEAIEGVERVYLLSAQQELPQLLERLQSWQPQFRYWRLSVGENLPPYHFV